MNDVLFPKMIDAISGGFAHCELMFDKMGRASDYRFLMVNALFEKQLNRDVESTIGETIRDVNPEIEQSWIDKIGSVVADNKPTSCNYFNSNTRKNYHVNVFAQTDNKFVILTEDIPTEIISIEEMTFQKGEYEELKAELILVNKKIEHQKRQKGQCEIECNIAKKKLANDDNHRLAFLATMSYEIRTPMNGILGFCELLKKSNITLEQQQDYIVILERFGNSMLIDLDVLASTFDPDLIRFEEIVQENIYSNLSVNEFAFLCNMSLSSFKRKFSEVYDVSPIKYIMTKKVQRASELLQVKENLISNIATDVGFKSVVTFNRFFKSYFGKSPSKFRMDETD